MSDFVATHVIQTGTRRHYVRACALNGGLDTLDNPRGVVLYTPEEWDACANADWAYDPEEGLRFQGSTSHPMLQCEVTIQPFADCRWTRVDGWNDDGTRASMIQQWAACEKLVGSDDVLVLAVAESRSSLVGMIADDILPIYYRTGARTPQVGDRLGTWVDVSTRYVMAPR